MAKTTTKEPAKATAVVEKPKPARRATVPVSAPAPSRKAAAVVAPKAAARKAAAVVAPKAAARKATAVIEKPKPAAKAAPKATAVIEKPKPAAKAPARKRATTAKGGGESGKGMGAALEALLAKGRDEGFITHDQILLAVPQPEAQPEAIEEFYAAAEEGGVEVLDADNNPTLIAEAGLDTDEAAAVTLPWIERSARPVRPRTKSQAHRSSTPAIDQVT